VYDALRKLAAASLATEAFGNTLEATKTADRYWVYTRAWIRREMEGGAAE
jgi:hypothetical protein